MPFILIVVCGAVTLAFKYWVAAGRAPAPNENNENNEKHGIPDNPPQQRTQGKNTPFGNPLTPIYMLSKLLDVLWLCLTAYVFLSVV